MANEKIIRIAVIGGSVRPDNLTWKALGVVASALEADVRVEVDRIDPRELTLALPGQSVDNDSGEALRERVGQAAGVVVGTPEYHGSYSSVIKLVIDNLGFPSVLRGKPIALAGVAAGRIGAIKATEHLRSVLSHVGALVLPNPISIAGVQNFFDAQGRVSDEGTEKALQSVAKTLLDYLDSHVCPAKELEAQARE
jgi:FMN reductase